MITVDFLFHKPFDLKDRRPYLDVVLLSDSGGRSDGYKSLVDTGSDFVILPMTAAMTAGITLSGNTTDLRLATGKAVLPIEKDLNLSIAGWKIQADVLFETSNDPNFIPIVGRAALLTAFDIGFQSTLCLWTKGGTARMHP